MISFQQQQNASPNGPLPPPQSTAIATSAEQPSMRLRDDPPPITPAPRTSRKRKSPSSHNVDPLPPSVSQPIQHVLPPPHALMHPLPGPLPGYSYPPADYTPGGLPPGQPQPAPPSGPQQAPHSPGSGRTLSQSKRAEQNRKAQRAFRERRDQCVMSTICCIPAELSCIGMSKLLNPVLSSWMPPWRQRMRPTGVGKSVVL